VINNSKPYFRKDSSSTLFTVSAAAIALLLLAASPMLFSNSLVLQPVQAQTPMTFKTPTPAENPDGLNLTFDAQGTTTPSGPDAAKITNGTIQVDQFTGNITSGFYATNLDPPYITFYTTLQNTDFSVQALCTTSEDSTIVVSPEGNCNGPFNGGAEFRGEVECSTSSPSSSSPMTGTAHDSDSDGIPDSSDNCPNHSHHRCFKEGDTSSGTTNEQQPPSSSSSSSGNQTRDR
jgi:hypothetical protein